MKISGSQQTEAALAEKKQRRQAKYRAWRNRRARFDYFPSQEALDVIRRFDRPGNSWVAVIDHLVLTAGKALGLIKDGQS